MRADDTAAALQLRMTSANDLLATIRDGRASAKVANTLVMRCSRELKIAFHFAQFRALENCVSLRSTWGLLPEKMLQIERREMAIFNSQEHRLWVWCLREGLEHSAR